jgi:hypothetical protein
MLGLREGGAMTDRLSDQDRAELRRLQQAATPGPWQHRGHWVFPAPGDESGFVAMCGDDARGHDDAAYIVAAYIEYLERTGNAERRISVGFLRGRDTARKWAKRWKAKAKAVRSTWKTWAGDWEMVALQAKAERDRLAAELAQLRAQLTEVRTAPDGSSDYLRDAVADSDGIII